MRQLLNVVILGMGLLVARSLLADSPPDSDPARLVAEVAGGQHSDMLGIHIDRGGQPPLTGYAKGLKPGGLDIRSATKSVTALLVGIAIDQGHLSSVEQAVIELLPEYAQTLAGDERKARIKLVDLLTMRSGLDCDDWNPQSPGHEDTMYEQRDWIAFWAATPMRQAPGEAFSYCTGNVIALGRILANATGEPVPVFAERVLFAPLGIERARWAHWNRGRDTDTGGHLRIHPAELARIGRLVLDRGRHGEQQLVSEAWIGAMTTAHTAIPDRPQSYGYLWWLDQTTRPELPRTRLQMAWGNGGNFMIVMPEIDTVVVFAGRRYNRPEGLEPLRWLGLRLLPAWRDAAAP